MQPIAQPIGADAQLLARLEDFAGVRRIDAVDIGRHQQQAELVLGQRVGIARQLFGRLLGKDLALGPHGTVDAVQARLGGGLGRLLEIEIQFLEDLPEHGHGRHRSLCIRVGGRVAGENPARIKCSRH